jgi:peptide deformylase
LRGSWGPEPGSRWRDRYCRSMKTMAGLKIEMLGAPVLRQKAEDVEVIDEELRILVDDMFKTMYEAEGIGLAGPQVGVTKRVLVIDVRDETHPRFALINPRIVEVGTGRDKEEEGCLSIPGVSALVERPTTVVVEALDQLGQPLRIEAEGLLARCIQHEVDHLDGVLFLDHLSSLKRSMLMKKYRALQAENGNGSRERPSVGRSG